MHYRVIVVTGLLLLAFTSLAVGAADPAMPPPASSRAGTWSINNWTPSDGVQLTLSYRKGSSRWEWSSTRPVADLEGLSSAQRHAVHASVAFTLRRDAGTFSFEGAFTLGIGRGDFHFVPDPSFAAKMSALGYEAVGEDADSLMAMAVRDVSLAYAGEVKKAGIEVARVSDLVRLLDHGVELDSIRAFGSAGYAQLTADDVVRFAEHGIDGAYLRGLKTAGAASLGPGEIVKLHDHGVGPDYVARIHAAGYGDLSTDEIIRLHEHGVD